MNKTGSLPIRENSRIRLLMVEVFWAWESEAVKLVYMLLLKVWGLPSLSGQPQFKLDITVSGFQH